MIKKYYHWIVMVSCCLMTAASVGILINAYGVMYTPLAKELGVGRGDVTLHATLLGIVSGFTIPFVVKLMDRIKYRIIALTGVILVVTSLLITAYAPNIMVINAAAILRGIGSACVYIQVATIILGKWFLKANGTVVGITLSFSGLSGAVFSPIVNAYVTAHGCRSTYIFLAILFACLSLPMLIFVTLRPEDMGLKAYGAEEFGDGKKFDEKQKDKNTEKISMLSPVAILMVIYSVIAIGTTCIGPHLSGYADSIGAGSATGALMLSAAMIGNILSKLINGVLIDAVGAIKATVIMLLTASLGLLLMLLVHEKAMLLVAAFLFGAIYAIGAASLPALLRHLYGPERFGSVYSKITPISSVGYSIFLTTAGYVYDLAGSYTPVFVTGIVFALLSVCIILAIQKINKN